MLGKLPLLVTTSIIMHLCGCMLPKDADIVGAAVIAELAQTQNARPSDIAIDRVTFQNRGQASVNATYRLTDGRIPHSVTFVCEAAKTEDRWKVKCAEGPNR